MIVVDVVLLLQTTVDDDRRRSTRGGGGGGGGGELHRARDGWGVRHGAGDEIGFWTNGVGVSVASGMGGAYGRSERRPRG